jgi:membrane protease YdiL (CAAX protease family)
VDCPIAIATFLVLVYATTTALVFVPQRLTEPGLLPGGATPHGILENVLGSAAPAFIVTALVSGKAGVRDLARRSFRWRLPLRCYAISLLAPLLILLIAITILYGLAPLRALAQNWLLLFAAFLAALAIMIVLNNVAEEIGWIGFVFARFQDRRGPLRAAVLMTLFFWLFHVPSTYVETRSWATTALALGIFLLPHLGSRVITGWLYNSASAQAAGWRTASRCRASRRSAAACGVTPATAPARTAPIRQRSPSTTGRTATR